jgi:hypothetical protein
MTGTTTITAARLDLKSAEGHTLWCALFGYRTRQMQGRLQKATR